MSQHMVQPLLEFIMSVIGVVTGVLAFLLWKRLRAGKKKAMVSFQLNQEKTVTEFRLLLIGMFIMVSGYVIYTYGGITGDVAATDIGRLSGIFNSFIAIVVFYRWVRRFK